MQLDPKFLPAIASLSDRAQALAMLDAIVCPEWEDRYYSFNARWSKAESMGSMRNGSGDDWFILFGTFGAAIKGLAHETSIAGDKVFASEVQRQVPQTFASFLAEPAFGMDWLSYCYWRSPKDSSWQKVVHPDPVLSLSEDGSTEYLALLVEPAASYEDFAKWYYELDIPVASIESIYNHSPLTEGLVRSLNPEISLAQAQEAAAEIGYPAARSDAQPGSQPDAAR
jgi:hypothetical protein